MRVGGDGKKRTLCKHEYLLSLQGADRIVVQVRHVDLFPFLLDLGMFPDHQPAAVREEETAQCVVRVGVRLRVLVVEAVIARPFYYVVLSHTNQHTSTFLCRLQWSSGTMPDCSMREPGTTTDAFVYHDHHFDIHPGQSEWVSSCLTSLSTHPGNQFHWY